jgi:hypothetical protein
VFTPVTEQKRAEQDDHDDEPGVHGIYRPKSIEDRLAGG